MLAASLVSCRLDCLARTFGAVAGTVKNSVREAMMMERRESENHHMAMEKELLDQLLAGRDPSEVFGKDGLPDDLKMTLTIPRDRAGTFDPKLIAKYQRRFPDFDAKIISMYARGMTVREIQGHLEDALRP